MSLVHRAAGPAAGRPVVLVHGWPESGRMWDPVIEALGAAGLRAIAPDLPGYGDSPPGADGTWATHVAALTDFCEEQLDGPAALVVHDWGGLIGLRVACDRPGMFDALVVSNSGFFGDGKWHGMAQELRTPTRGEQLVDGLTRDSFGQLLRGLSPGISEAAVDDYFRPFATPEGRARQLELYRSGNMEELEAYEGALAALGVPLLALWGARDAFAPVAGAHRLAAEVPGARVEILDHAGHFAPEDDPEAYAAALVAFLTA